MMALALSSVVWRHASSIAYAGMQHEQQRLTVVQAVVRGYSCGVCTSSVTTCVGGGVYLLCLPSSDVPFSTDIFSKLSTKQWFGHRAIYIEEGRSEETYMLSSSSCYQLSHSINAIAARRHICCLVCTCL
jgi:hypothetical protein